MMKATKILSIAFMGLLAICMIPPVAAEGAAVSGDSVQGSEDRLMLRAGSDEVLSLYRHVQSGRFDGGVILLHDQGAHPDWPGVIQTLRRELPRYGWSTLSVGLPALGEASQSPSEVVKEWSERVPAYIDAALVALEERNIFNIVLIGHGSGAAVAAHYIKKTAGDRIQGLIAISMDGSRVEDESVDGAMLLRGVNNRIYDIYGGRDLAPVLGSAVRRELTVISGEPGKKRYHMRAADIATSFNQQSAGRISYRQHRIEGADHQFRGYEKQLLYRVVGWLRRYVGGSSIKIARDK